MTYVTGARRFYCQNDGSPYHRDRPMNDAAGAAIETRALTKTYDGKVQALRGVDLSVKRGEMFALLGPNGAGKTTLFSILSTLRKPSGGEARVLGLDVLTERSALRQRMG